MTPTVRRSGLSVICCHGLREGRVTANQYKVVSDHLYSTMKHFYPDEGGLFLDENASIHQARGVTDWSDEYESDVNHMLWPLQSTLLKHFMLDFNFNLSPVNFMDINRF